MLSAQEGLYVAYKGSRRMELNLIEELTLRAPVGNPQVKGYMV